MTSESVRESEGVFQEESSLCVAVGRRHGSCDWPWPARNGLRSRVDTPGLDREVRACQIWPRRRARLVGMTVYAPGGVPLGGVSPDMNFAIGLRLSGA